MNPYSEQTLTEEVLYLHSLWRRGPPNKRPADPKNRKNKKKKPRPEPPQDSGPEWPCPEPVQNQPSTSSGWPPIRVSTPAAQPVSSDERANLAALQLQYKGSDACRGFFARNADSGSDEEGEEEEEAEGIDEEMMESEEYKFFLKLFVENDELRGYYEKNSESGLFCCLVCGGMGKKKSGKRFKNCVGLVQHSISISRTKKKRAHRAFGQVVCRVFGWDIDRLPTIVLKGEPLGRSLVDYGDLKVQPEEIRVAKEQDDIDKKNEVVSVDENEQKLQEEKTTQDPTSNSKEVPESIFKATKEFFAAFLTSMGDGDVSENNLIDIVEERIEFKFFLKLFTENESLRRYYENNHDDGEFFCLACEGSGKKSLKNFKTCGRLLQHTTSLGKSQIWKEPVQNPHRAKIFKMKMLAHRAYSLVICKVLGWDIEKLPAVVLTGEALGCSLTKSDMSKDESVGKAVDNSEEANDPVEDYSSKIN